MQWQLTWLALVMSLMVFFVLCFFPGGFERNNKAKFVVCSLISLALSFWMKHLVIGQLQKPAKFSAFHWSTSRSQAYWSAFGKQQGSKFTETNRNGFIHHAGCLSDRNGPILDLVYPILTIFLN